MQSNRKHSGSIAVLTLVLGLALGAGPARAQVSSWTNTSSSTFGDPNSWSSGVPLAGTNAVFGLGGQTYTVTFDANQNNASALVTGSTQAVTWDLSGNKTYSLAPPSGHALDVGTGATDSVTLTITGNGTVSASAGTAGNLSVGAGSTVIISNGAYVNPNGYLTSDGTLVVSGPGSQIYAGNGIGKQGMIIVTNGGFFRGSGAGINNATVSDSGSIYCIWSMLDAPGKTLRVTNGGLLTSTPDYLLLGQVGADGTSRLIVGGPIGVSTVDTGGISTEEVNPVARPDTETIVSTNGVVRLRGGRARYWYSDSSFAKGSVDWRLQDGNILTLRGGSIAMNTNTVLGFTDNNVATVGFAATGTGILRGYGTISNYNAGTNFRIVNDGVIRPGDLGVETGAISSNILGIGTISILRGDLLQTNANAAAALSIDFDPLTPGSADLIDITGGNILITSGSNIFNNISGTLTFGTWDFLKADVITNLPAYDNLTTIIDGMTNQLGSLLAGYTYGVVDLPGGGQALELSINMIPEPSTILLLVGGGMLVWRVRRRR